MESDSVSGSLSGIKGFLRNHRSGIMLISVILNFTNLLLSIVMVVAFSFMLGIRRLRNVRRGELAEDELSKEMLRKTAAISFYISLYIWLFLIYFNDRITIETDLLIEKGILAMAVTYGISWLVIHSRGGMDNRIKEFRARLNITRAELAKQVNVRRETIVFLEKNKYNPSLKLAYDLASYFAVSIEELFVFDNTKKKDEYP